MHLGFLSYSEYFTLQAAQGEEKGEGANVLNNTVFIVLISVVRSRNNVVNNYTGGGGGPDYPHAGPPDVLSTIMRIASFCVILTLFFIRLFHSVSIVIYSSSRHLPEICRFMSSKYTFLSFFLCFQVFCFSFVFTPTFFLLLFFLSSPLLLFFYFFGVLRYSFFYCHF